MTSILLVDEGWAQTLPLASALAKAGFEITVATANGEGEGIRHRGVTWVSAPCFDDPAFGRWLDGATRACTFEAIVPLTERAMARLWASPHHDSVFPATTPAQRALLADKHALIEHLASCGVPTVRQIRVDLQRASVVPALCTLGFPVVLKGSTGEGGARVRILDDSSTLEDVLARARALGGDWVLQAFAPGPTYLVGGVFDRGRAVRLYAAEKRELFPARTGPAIRLVSTVDPRVRELGQRVLRELQWTGLASVDIIARRDGQLAVLEVNPRPWGSIAAAAAAGVDLYEPFAALLRGEHPAEDLGCADGEDSWVFPRYLLAPQHRRAGGVLRALRDLAGPQGAEWRDLRLLIHALDRLLRLPAGRGL